LAFYGYLCAYTASSPAARKGWLTGALIAYAFSLLAKSVGMTLPLVLMLVDIYPLRRVSISPTPTAAWARQDAFCGRNYHSLP
jgi:hypothetical protein